MKKRILITGSQGFIGGYLVAHFLSEGWEVVGVDNFSKYGRIARTHDAHPSFKLVEADARDTHILQKHLAGCTQFVAAAAIVGGISLFHKVPYDLFAANMELTTAALDAARHAHSSDVLQKITVLSSSMVFENATSFPSKEGDELQCPPPHSSYGFQKLAVEVATRACQEQYGLPYTILRPFNAIGTGEQKPLLHDELIDGIRTMVTSHVVPDLILKVLRGLDPLPILGDGNQTRCYTCGEDIAKGVYMAVVSDRAANEDFNISSTKPHTVKELARIIWDKIHPGRELHFKHEPGFPHDVPFRVPDTSKAARLLGFTAETPLEDALDPIIAWMREAEIQGIV